MDVRRLRADEWQRWREFRLAMLQEAPYAYGTSYAEASAMTEEEWQRRAHAFATSDEQVMYVVEEDGEWLAAAGGYRDDDGVPNVISVWTRPAARGRRAAQRAIEAVIAWAETTGADDVRLWATDTNYAANRVYARLGFAPNGNTQPLPSDPSLTESEYSRPLRRAT